MKIIIKRKVMPIVNLPRTYEGNVCFRTRANMNLIPIFRGLSIMTKKIG